MGWPTNFWKRHIIDSQALHAFASIDLSARGIPDATTLLHFRHLLEVHRLTQAILDTVNGHLCEQKMILREGTIECHDHRRALVHQEQRAPSRSGNAPDQERQRVALWDGSAHWRAKAQVRALVEHPFHIVKNLFHHRKVRYREIFKNTARLHILFALANLVIAKRTLLAPARA